MLVVIASSSKMKFVPFWWVSKHAVWDSYLLDFAWGLIPPLEAPQLRQSWWQCETHVTHAFVGIEMQFFFSWVGSNQIVSWWCCGASFGLVVANGFNNNFWICCSYVLFLLLSVIMILSSPHSRTEFLTLFFYANIVFAIKMLLI